MELTAILLYDMRRAVRTDLKPKATAHTGWTTLEKASPIDETKGCQRDL
jgi:hypothetical protein